MISQAKIVKNEMHDEINEIYVEKPSATLRELFKTDEDFVSRDYVIIENEKIVMWTKNPFLSVTLNKKCSGEIKWALS